MTKQEALTFFANRKNAYLLAFGTPEGKIILEDLSPFCRARESCVVVGDRDRTYVLEGRREVYIRIMEHLELTPEQLLEIYTRPAQGATSHAE